MDKKLLTVIGILGGLVLLYFINLGIQNSYSSDTAKILLAFNIDILENKFLKKEKIFNEISLLYSL